MRDEKESKQRMRTLLYEIQPLSIKLDSFSSLIPILFLVTLDGSL
jgi:hypothetical protein